METGTLGRKTRATVVAGASALALSACGDVIAGDLEYKSDGTASRTYYERIEKDDYLPPERGDIDSIVTYECEEPAPGPRFVHVTSRDTEGNILEETSQTSTACRDDLKITAPEIP